MAKKKFNEKSTLMGRMGFKDPDLKLPSHDKVMLWLYKEDIIKKICKEQILPDYIKKHVRKPIDKHYNTFEEVSDKMLAEKFTLITQFEKYDFKNSILEKVIEFNIENDKQYDIGFVDLCIICRMSYPLITIKKDLKNLLSESLDITEKVAIIGIFFEVKVQDITLGELMRQLNLYKKYGWTSLQNAIPSRSSLDAFYRFVVTPSNNILKSYSSILQEQGWYFVEAPFTQQKSEQNSSTQSSLDSFSK
jgi:hypothetical protein